MKILFICWANVGRSQMAATVYNHLTKSKNADSTGTEVSHPGATLMERKQRRGGTYVIDVMAEHGYDVSQNIRTQLITAMLDRYDRIINMAQPEYTPDWLSSHSHYEFWDVKDPGGRGKQETERAYQEIRAYVKSIC